jgi:peptidoglycan/LPS O-acetylase OafA/YrhL
MRPIALFTGPKVGDFRGRDNNFNLIRFTAATLVIWTHAFGLLDLTRREPVFHVFGIGAGDVGVDIFFVLSGFLVSKSWDGKTLAQFAWARCMRIYPGLWASLLVSVGVVALFFTDEPLARFLGSASTASYLAHNATLLPTLGARLTLPHAFHYSGDAFNVPLWTLPLELQMYALLAAIGIIVGLRAPVVGAVSLLGVAGVVLDKLGGTHLMTMDRGRFLYLFFAGALLYTLRNQIVLRTWIAATLACIVAATVALTDREVIRQAVLLGALPYLLLWCGLVPRGLIRQWNRLGDYSYGMYIYGFPVQLALISTGVTAASSTNFLLSMLITLPIAIASWHLLESRMLHRRLPSPLAFDFPRRAPSPND